MTCSRARACELSAVALPEEASASASCARALATEEGSEVAASSSSNNVGPAGCFCSGLFFPASAEAEARRNDLRRDDACLACRDVLVNLLSLTGAPADSVLACAAAPSPSPAANPGPATHSQRPAAMIKAERPLALLFIPVSPIVDP